MMCLVGGECGKDRQMLDLSRHVFAFEQRVSGRPWGRRYRMKRQKDCPRATMRCACGTLACHAVACRVMHTCVWPGGARARPRREGGVRPPSL